jgi:arylsulfatase A-like enzyme
MIRLSAVTLACFCASGLSLPAQERSPQGPPNIVLILADDLGWTDLGCYGTRYYETPNIDRLAREGMRFTQAYASAAQCAPTRACLMTGRDVGRHGIWAVERVKGLEQFRRMTPPENNTELPLAEVTIADVLRKAGYRTGMFGKWHLGEDDPYQPRNRGFDDSLTFKEDYQHIGFTTRPPSQIKPGTYLADFLTDQAVRFIEQNKDRPFFLYLPHFSVHGPIIPKPELVPHYARKPPHGGHRNPEYAAMIQSLDESVGRIAARIDELGLAGNTLLVFTSDNGGAGGYERDGVSWFSPTSNEPLRGGKGMLYEGGIRIPLIARWPGVVAAGTTSEAQVISTDFFPTFVALAGRKPDPDRPLDGFNMLPVLRGAARATPGRDAFYWHYPSYLHAEKEKGTWRITPSGAIRSGDLKLIEWFEDSRVELYDLRRDPGETRDLAREMPDKAEALRRRLADWRRATGALMPVAK